VDAVQRDEEQATWSDDELRSVITEYMSMLEAERAGDPYVKARYNERVREKTGRSKGSVEFKFSNISAVLDAHGQPWIRGYAPRRNYQSALENAVLAHLADHGIDPDSGTVRPAVSEDPYLRLEHLWERATGGTAVAVSPTHDGEGSWPTGPSAVGADEAVQHLLSALEDRSDIVQHLVFLVGGPGNGKSALAARASQGMQSVGVVDRNLAHRTYRYKAESGRELLVINDATIPDTSNPSGSSLIDDVSRALREGACVLANINRGVLYEELSKLGAAEHQTQAALAEAVVKWVHDVAVTLGDDGASGLQPVQYRDFEPLRDDAVVRVGVILMDVCSLFEMRPSISISDDTARLSEPYAISRLTERADLDVACVPAATLLADFHERLDPELRMRPDWDPIRANLESLDQIRTQAGLLVFLRAAELASSRRFTYRELWGAYVRSVVGGLPEKHSPKQSRELLKALDPQDVNDPYERFRLLARLATLRLHQAVVGAPPLEAEGTSQRSMRTHPVLRLTRLVDPALDATPEWSRPVLESFAFPDEDQSPLRALLAHPDGECLTGGVVTRFDQVLDDAYTEAVGAVADSPRRAIDSWYGGYLLRLFALASYRPAFAKEIDEWTRAWRLSNWPPLVRAALQTLIFPKRTSGEAMVLPVLEARAHPVVGTSEVPRLVRIVETQNTGIKKVRRGESLFVSIDAGQGETAELEFDFDLLREALACHDGELGLSDRARATLPRLERFRANLLKPQLDLDYGVVAQDRVSVLEVEV
jgi:hypothetical protein